MKKFWGYASNNCYSVGCTGQTVYLFDKNGNEIKKFKDLIYGYTPMISPDGKIFVVTGSVEHFANRKELQALIESKGGKVTGSVTAKTSYLINNDVTSNSSKNKKAKELGVPIISEVDFLEMVGNRK